jgi:hypothetical protein
MVVYVLMFGMEYEGYDSEVKVFASYESAKAEGERYMSDATSFKFDYYHVEPTNLI